MNKKERQAQKKIDRLNRKSNAINPDTGVKYDRKKQKTARLMKEAEDNRKLASASSEGAQRQAEQNKSISARKTGTLKSNERTLRESDMSKSTKNTLVDKKLGVGAEKKKIINPTKPEVAGVTSADLAGTDDVKTNLTKKTPDFFKKKTPLKMKYFK